MRSRRILLTGLCRWVKSPSPQSWFVTIAALFGLAFIACLAPFNVPDEHNHFYRAYQISEGGFLPEKQALGTGGTVPQSLFNTVEQGNKYFGLGKLDTLNHMPLDPHKQVFVRFENTALYSPVPYLPQALGIAVGRFFDASPILLLYLGRLTNLLTYVLLFYWAIRLLPFGKWAFVIIGLLPMHLLLASSLSTDTVTISLLALLVASVLHVRTLTRPLSYKGQLFLASLAIAISLTKPPFHLFLALLVLIPRHMWGKTLFKQLTWLGGILLTAAVLGGAWLLASNRLGSPYGPPGIDPAGQITFIGQHFATYLKVLWRTFTDYSDYFTQQYVLSVGFIQEWLPLWVTYVYSIFLAMAVYPIRAVRGTFSKIEKSLLGTLIFLCFIIIATLLYLSWTAVGSREVQGMQARYFTPFFLLLVPLLALRSTKALRKEGSLNPVFYQWGVVAFLICGLAETFSWFYRQ